MRRVVIESPCSPSNGRTYEQNLHYARQCMLDSLSMGEAPWASHLLYTQVLNEHKEADRERGISAGLEWSSKASICAVYEDFGITDGMKRGIALAKSRSIRVEHRNLPTRLMPNDKPS